MRDDTPDQPGRCGASLTNAVRVGLALVIMIFLEGRARAQSGMDVSDVSPISLHPGVPTVVQMPDEIEHTWVFHGGEFMVQGVRDKLYLRPRPGTRAGVEGLVEVKAGTLHQVFWLRVVKHVEDAQREVVVPPVVAAQCAEPAAPPAIPATEPAAAEPSASAPASTPAPAEPSTPEPAEPEGAVTTEPEDTAVADRERDAATGDARDVDAAGSPRFELSVQAVAALAGTTELSVAGYEARSARRSHRAFGLRVAVAPPDAWWAVEANVSWEQLVTPTVHDRGDGAESVAVSGGWLRADVGMSARFGTPLSPTAYAGGGLQAHHRDVETPPTRPGNGPRGDMPLGGVLALGLGLEYRTGNLLLGLGLHIRKGVPADYHSVAALLSVGFFLDQGE